MIIKDKYQIKVNNENNEVELNIEGNAEQEELQEFLKDYNDTISKIKPETMELIVDCTKMQVLTSDMVPALESCFELYKTSGFKQVVFTIQSNAVLKMQLSRLARNSGLTNTVVREK